MALISGISLFVLKYQVKELEETLKITHKEILQTKRDIHMLEVEWAHLNDPAILLDIVQKHTDWKIISPKQIGMLSDIPMKPLMLPVEPEVVLKDKVENVEKQPKKTFKEMIKVVTNPQKTNQNSSVSNKKNKSSQKNQTKENLFLKKGSDALSSLRKGRVE